MATGDIEAGLTALAMAPDPSCSGRVIQTSLVTLRKHLGMDVAFIGSFRSGCRFFEYVDADSAACPVRTGGSDPLEHTYCGRVVEGRLPELITDAAEVPEAAALPVTSELPVGAHLSVPLRRSNGEVLGTLCCFSHEPDHTLRERDLRLMHMFAELVATHMETLLKHEERVGQIRNRVRDVIDAGGPEIAVQPIRVLGTDEVFAFEALSRFPVQLDHDLLADLWDPAQWFHEAGRVGMGPELETAAVANALALRPLLPHDALLSINLSARSLAHRPMLDLILGTDTSRLLVELTEQTPVTNYLSLAGPLGRIRAAGAQLAVDDAGSGYAGLEHILQLRPEVVKLDRFLVTGLTTHPGRRAMVEAMVGFAGRMGVELVAEGVETADDVTTLSEMGVRLGQGYHLGRPSLELSQAC